MYLGYLDLNNLRSIQKATLELSPSANLIVGKNGSGKTTTLEGVYLLTKKRSFVTRNLKKLIQNGKQEAILFGQVTGSDDLPSMGVSITNQKITTRLNKSEVKTKDFIGVLPTGVIESGSSNAFLQSPHIKRKYIDLSVFHVEPCFLNVYISYRKSLTHRNAALKNNTNIDIWDKPVIDYGLAITSMRKAFIDRANVHFEEITNKFFGYKCFIRFYEGWKGNFFADVLKKNRVMDKRYRYTQAGPHRADYEFFSEKGPVKNYFSRGQIKVIYSIFILAQTKVYQEILRKRGLLLFDDPMSELDDESLEFLIGESHALDVQLVLTSIREHKLFMDLNPKLFHVEHGKIIEA